jgi:predicted O-methyltransferase YrrM
VYTEGVIRDAIKRATAAIGHSGPGRQLLYAATEHDRTSERFSQVESWPSSAQGFEDLDFLFTSSQLDHGVASLRFDEAALLYRVVRDAGKATIVEIGRFKGGSTLIMATAMAPGSVIWSYDLHVAARADLSGPGLDAELLDALSRLGRTEGVNLEVGDSRAVEIPAGAIDVLFIDGDHSYEGAKADIERWGPYVREGGHMLLHDAVGTGGFATAFPGVQRAASEIVPANLFAQARGAGTIAHFVRVA